MNETTFHLVDPDQRPAGVLKLFARLIDLCTPESRSPMWYDAHEAKEFLFATDGQVGHALRCARPGKDPAETVKVLVLGGMALGRNPGIRWHEWFGLDKAGWIHERHLDRVFHARHGLPEMADLPGDRGFPLEIPTTATANRELVERALAWFGVKPDGVFYWHNPASRYLVISPMVEGGPLAGDWAAIIPPGGR